MTFEASGEVAFGNKSEVVVTTASAIFLLRNAASTSRVQNRWTSLFLADSLLLVWEIASLFKGSKSVRLGDSSWASIGKRVFSSLRRCILFRGSWLSFVQYLFLEFHLTFFKYDLLSQSLNPFFALRALEFVRLTVIKSAITAFATSPTNTTSVHTTTYWDIKTAWFCIHCKSFSSCISRGIIGKASMRFLLLLLTWYCKIP